MPTSLAARLVPPFHPETVRLRLRVLLLLGISQALAFGWLPLRSYYGGSRALLLTVQTTGAFARLHPHLYQRLDSPAGSFATGGTGELWYHATSLGNYLLFYSLGGFTILDALFVLASTAYLYLALRRLPAGRELTGRVSQAFAMVGSAAMLMYVGHLLWNNLLYAAFQRSTHGLFGLIPPASPTLYMVFGSLLVLGASFLELGQRVQQENELTI